MSLSWNLVANLRFFFERNNCFDGNFILCGGAAEISNNNFLFLQLDYNGKLTYRM